LFGLASVGAAADFVPLVSVHCLLRLAVLLHLRGIEGTVVFDLRVSHSFTHFLDVLRGPLLLHHCPLDLH
jgi:hypothetical protein